MKSSLLRALIKKYAGLLIAMLVVPSLGCALMAGMANGFVSLKNTLTDYCIDMKYPDAVIETKVMSDDVLEELSEIPGVEEANGRLIGNLILIGKDGSYYSMQAMSYSEKEFQGTYFWEKTDQEAEFPVLLEYRFARLNDFHAGDPVEIRVQDRSWDCTVSAVISRPEMIAHHKLGDMTVWSTDIGYVYIPAGSLKKVADSDYDSSSSEWEESNAEFNRQKTDAKEEYESILGEIDDAQKLLDEKEAELDEKIKTAGSEKEQLLQYREEIAAKKKELEEKEAGLLEQKTQLEQTEKELQKAEEEASKGKKELTEKKETLDSTKSTLKKKQKELQDQLGELEKAETELSQKREEAQTGAAEIERTLLELADNESRLNSAKTELLAQQAVLYRLKDAVLALKGLAASVKDFIRTADKADDPKAWAADAAGQLDSMISEAENTAAILEELSRESLVIDYLKPMGFSKSQIDSAIDGLYAYIDEMRDLQKELLRLSEESGDPAEIEVIRQSLIQRFKAAIELYEQEHEFTEEAFALLIEQIDAAVSEMNSALLKIDDGLAQIADGRALLAEKQKEVEDGFSQIEEGELQLAEAREAILEGMAQIDEGLEAVASGYGEIDRYTKELEKAESEIAAGRLELSEYEQDFLDAQTALAEARDTLLKSEEEVEDGIRQIDDAVTDGKQQLSDGKDEIEQNRETAVEHWLDALRQFKDVESEIDEARRELDGWHGYDEFCNQFLLRFEPDADPESTLAEAEKVLGTEKIKNSFTYKDSPVRHSIQINTDPLEIMALYVPLLFFVVALIVEFLFMSFLIRQCRREIGILRALGFSKNSILALFCSMNLLVSAGAILLGLVISVGISRFIGTTFRNYFNLYFFNNEIHWGRLLISMALTVVVGQIATVVSARYLSRVPPTEAMSRPAPAAAASDKRRLLSSLKLPPFYKYCISSLLRNKKRLLFSIVCLASSVVLIFTAFSFDFSKNRILSEQFEDRIHYDCEIFLDPEADEDLMGRLLASGLVQDPEAVSYYTRDIESEGIIQEATVKAIAPETDLLQIYDGSGNRLFASDDGILLEKHTAAPLTVSEGDTVLVGGAPMRVLGIPEENENRYQYISRDSAQALGAPDMRSIICNVKKENENPLMEFLSKEDSYIYAAFTYRTFAELQNTFEAFGTSALIILLFAVAIGSVIVVNTFCTSLQDQKKDLCVLRTLGFQYSGLSLRLMMQAAVYYVFACIIGIPSGIALTKLILNKLEVPDRSYPFVNDFRIYLFTLLLVLAYIAVSHFISMRSLKKWDLVETVKDKE